MRKLVLAVTLVVWSGLIAGCQGQKRSTYTNSAGSLALSTDDSLLYAADADNDFIAVIDTGTEAKIAEVKVGRDPERVCVGADDAIWVTNRGSRSVSMIRRGDWREAARIAVGVEPVGLAVSPDDRTVYVVSSTSLESSDYGTLTAIDVETLSPAWTMAVGPEPRAISLIGNDRAVISFFKEGDLALVDLAKREVLRAGTDLYRRANASKLSGTARYGSRGSVFSSFFPRSGNDVVASPDGERLYSAVVWSREERIMVTPNAVTGYYGDGGPCNVGAIATPGVVTTALDRFRAVVDDLTTCSVGTDAADRDYPPSAITTPSVRRPIQGPAAMAIDPTGAWLYVVNRQSNNVAVIPTRTRQVAGLDFESSGSSVRSLVPVGSGPNGIALTRDGRKAYVYNAFDHSVSTLTSQGRGNNAVIVSNDREPIRVASDPIGEGRNAEFYAGRKLFFDATDSRVNNVSVGVACATCHPAGADDGHTWGFPDGPRQTPALAGRQILNTAPYHWDGEFATLQDFVDHTVRLRMGGTGLSPALTRQLAAYIDGLAPADNPHVLDVPTDAQRRGKEIFQMGQCDSCHSGPWLTNNGFADVGTRLTGGANPDNPEKLTRGFNVPSLLSLARTAPYLHDGSAATLKDRLMRDRGSNRHGALAEVSDSQINDLVEYLKTL